MIDLILDIAVRCGIITMVAKYIYDLGEPRRELLRELDKRIQHDQDRAGYIVDGKTFVSYREVAEYDDR